jgi:hypothetical protein
MVKFKSVQDLKVLNSPVLDLKRKNKNKNKKNSKPNRKVVGTWQKNN